MSDLIKREDAIKAVAIAVLDDRDELEAIKAIPSVQVSGDLISRADAIKALRIEYEAVLNCEEDPTIWNYKECAIDRLYALPSAENSNAKTQNSNQETQNSNQETQKSNGDLIYRADAIEAVRKLIEEPRQYYTQYNNGIEHSVKALSALPSAEAVQGWIPFTRRPMTEEEQKDYPNCTFMFDCVLPDDGDEILVSNGRFVWMDIFCNDIDGCYLDSGDDIDEDMAWMPLPKPYREDGEV